MRLRTCKFMMGCELADSTQAEKAYRNVPEFVTPKDNETGVRVTEIGKQVTYLQN